MSLTPGNRNGSSLNLLAKVQTLSILYAAVFLTRIGFGTILVIFPTYLSISSLMLAPILALYPALEGLSALPVGAWIDRSGRRRAFILGMALITVLTWVISLTRTDVPLVAGAHAIMGLAAAMVTISSLTMITDLTTVENLGAGMGAFDLANLSGYGVGVISGTLLAKIFVQSVGTIFQIVAGMFAAATIFALLALREPPHISTGEQFSIESPGALFRDVSGSFGEMASIYPLWFSLTIIIGFYFFLPKIAAGSSFSLSSSAGLVVIAAGL